MPKKAATKANAAKQEADTGVAAPPKAGGGVMPKGKHEGDVAAKKKEKDLNSPKKPVAGAYGVYLAANREAIKKTLPADHKTTDVAKAAGTRITVADVAEAMPEWPADWFSVWSIQGLVVLVRLWIAGPDLHKGHYLRPSGHDPEPSRNQPGIARNQPGTNTEPTRNQLGEAVLVPGWIRIGSGWFQGSGSCPEGPR
jgi:hypothetical protein